MTALSVEAGLSRGLPSVSAAVPARDYIHARVVKVTARRIVLRHDVSGVQVVLPRLDCIVVREGEWLRVSVSEALGRSNEF